MTGLVSKPKNMMKPLNRQAIVKSSIQVRGFFSAGLFGQRNNTILWL